MLMRGSFQIYCTSDSCFFNRRRSVLCAIFPGQAHISHRNPSQRPETQTTPNLPEREIFRMHESLTRRDANHPDSVIGSVQAGQMCKPENLQIMLTMQFSRWPPSDFNIR